MHSDPKTSRAKFSRLSPRQRRETLIAATLSLIERAGMEGVTVRAIALQAGVTPGLIRHHFSGKQDLIAAAYATHMAGLTSLTFDAIDSTEEPACQRLTKMIQLSLRPPVSSARNLALWAGFLSHVRRDPRMQTTHEQSYVEFRDRLQTLIADALAEQDRYPAPDRLRRFAIACNATIDGLWLEGGALPGTFASGELADIGLQSISAILNLDLQPKALPT